MAQIPIFDPFIFKLHREKSAKKFYEYDYLINFSAEDLIERVGFFSNKFENILDLGARNGLIAKELQLKHPESFVVASDVAWNFITQNLGEHKVNSDDALLPFAPNSFDLIISNLNLHWMNDPLDFFKQIKTILKSEGVFIANFFGEGSLMNFKKLMAVKELEHSGGARQRVIPMISHEQITSIAKLAGATKIITDINPVTVEYSSVYKLMKDLQFMGESSAIANNANFLPKKLVEELKLYNIVENFDIITVTIIK